MYATGCWYAVRVRREREFHVATSLLCKGYEIFLPQYRSLRRIGGQLRERDVALFPGYLFCSIRAGVSGDVLPTPGVISFVSSGRTPLEIDPDEIGALRCAVAQSNAEPWPFVRAGERIRVERGALQGVEGIVVRVKNRFRLVISITMLQRSAAVEIDIDDVGPLYDRRGLAIEPLSY
jgi:transcription antitermination factor NusG